jgi:hypothetical protein
MPLIQLWEKTPDIVLQYNIKQIVSAAGEGVLSDGSECSRELRHYLRNIPAEKLYDHVDYCLSNSFDKSGLVLQDIINELGRRLDYEVEDGLYQGRSNQIGYDGIWKAPNGHAIIIEIKTTDAYRINLDTVASYRNKLIESGRITGESSILVVVGRNDTGDLEAQIRGSRHAWDARIISTEALVKLVELKVKSDEDETIEKIRSLLIPFEYTRLDNIIDVMFTAARDVEAGADEVDQIQEEESVVNERDGYKQDHTPRDILEKVRKSAVDSLANREGVNLIAHKRVQFWSSDKKVRAVCPVSKKYGQGYYWYGFNPRQKDFLAEADSGFLVMACVDLQFAFAVPYEVLEPIIPYLNVTENDEGITHWHLQINPPENGEYQFVIPKKGEKLSLKKYEIQLPQIQPVKIAV